MVADVYVVAFVAAVMIAMIGFTVGLTWYSLRSDAHSPSHPDRE